MKLQKAKLLEELRFAGAPSTRLAIARQLDLDVRPIEAGLLDTVYVAHFMAIRDVINPKNAQLSVMNFAAGMDLSTNLLAFNPAEVFMLAQYSGLSLDVLTYFQKNIQNFRAQHAQEYLAYRKEKFSISFSSTSLVNTAEGMIVSLDSELSGLGNDFGDPSDVRIEMGEYGPRIRFYWRYHRSDTATLRTINFISNPDLTESDKYRPELLLLLRKGVDVYFHKAAEGLAATYGMKSSFMHFIRPAIKKYFVTDDASFSVNEKWVDHHPEFPLDLPRVRIHQHQLIWTAILELLNTIEEHATKNGMAKCRYGKYLCIRAQH